MVARNITNTGGQNMKIKEMLEDVQKKLDGDLSDEEYSRLSGLELYYQQIIWQNSKKGGQNG